MSRRQVDQDKASAPAWLIAAQVNAKKTPRQKAPGHGNGKGRERTAWVFQESSSSKKPAIHSASSAGVVTFQGRPSTTLEDSTPPTAYSQPPETTSGEAIEPEAKSPVLDSVTRAELNPEFLTVLEDVMGQDSDEDYEAPDVDDDLDVPEPDYDSPPRKHQPLAATSSSPANVGTPSHRPLGERHSTGEEIKGQMKSIGLQTEPVSHSSAPDALDSLERDFAPNLRITAAHQARLLREAGRGRNGQRKQGSGLVRKKSASFKHASGATTADIWRRGSKHEEVSRSPRDRSKVLSNLQKAMDSGWFYGYGIVVKNLKERLEYISKHQADKPSGRRKSIDVARTRDRLHPEDNARYEAGMTRELAVEILRRQRVGSYILRDSLSNPGHLAISVKKTRGRDPTVINHFLLLRTPRGGVSLKGFKREWLSLRDFIASMSQTVIGRDLELSRYLGIR